MGPHRPPGLWSPKDIPRCPTLSLALYVQKRKFKTEEQRSFDNFKNYYYAQITKPSRLKKILKVLTYVHKYTCTHVRIS